MSPCSEEGADRLSTGCAVTVCSKWRGYFAGTVVSGTRIEKVIFLQRQEPWISIDPLRKGGPVF